MSYYIYLTTNIINNKKYIGQHCGEINDKYLGSGIALQKAIKFYGKENFKKEILKICEKKEDLDYWEKYFIKQYNAYEDKNFYNLTEGGQKGDGWKAANRWFKNHPEEAKKLYLKNYENLKNWKEKHPKDYQEKVIKALLRGSAKWRANNPEKVKQHMIKVNEAKVKWQNENPEEYKKLKDKWRQAGSIANSQKVLCLTTNEIFESQSAAARYYNIPQANISKCLKGERKSAGKHPETKEKLYWKLIEE